MKKSFLALALALAVVCASAESPFSITPRVEKSAGGLRRLTVEFGVPASHQIYSEKIHFSLDESESTAAFDLPQPEIVKDKFSGEEKKVFKQSFSASASLGDSVPASFQLKVRFQGCDVAECFFPEDRKFNIGANGEVVAMVEGGDETVGSADADWTKLAGGFAVANRGSGYVNEKDFLKFLDHASGMGGEEGLMFKSGFWGILMTMSLILIGGAALNLTPCILPMIPINLAIIGAGAQAGSRKRGFALGATYGAGMAVAYGVLGLIVVMTGAKFGTLNSSVWFNVGIAAVFGLLALGMFDVFSIDLSRFQSGGGNAAAAKSKFILAYTMGTVAALLAGACVAPVVISVLLQATTLHARGVAVGLLLPFVLGLGMGLPWPFAGAGLSFLPKPGRWMVRVKQGFGVVIVLFAAYYGHIAWGLSRNSTPVSARESSGNVIAATDESFTAPLRAALEASAVDGKPVFVDFAASWCKNCVAMEHTTFESVTVKQRLAGYHVVRLQAEKPNEAPARPVLDHFGVIGLPSFVVLHPAAAKK